MASGFRRFWFWFLMVVVLPASPLAAEEQPRFERWYVMLMQDQPIGWVHSTEVEKDGVIESTETVQITMRRGQVAISMSIADRFWETTDGKPIRCEHVEQLAAQATILKVEWTDQGAMLTRSFGAPDQREQTEPLTLEGEWLTPAAARRFVDERLAKGEKEIVTRTLIFMNGPRLVETKQEIIVKSDVEVLGKIIPALEARTTSSLMPNVTSREYVDESGRILRSTTQFGGLEILVLQADEVLAKAQVKPPDLLGSLMVGVDKPIENPRHLRRATYELSLIQDQTNWTLPTTAIQRVTIQQNGNMRVAIDVTNPERQAQPPDNAYLEPSLMIDNRDTLIRELTDKALQGANQSSPADKADKLCRFVNGYINQRALDVGYASASEVVQTRQGDCSEFGVLLAAMLRAADIPSRTVSGLVYVPSFLGHENVFGYHMWTQAWIADPEGKGGCWMDLDAALNPDGLDATHIALGMGSADGAIEQNGIIQMLLVLGNLKIRVLETGE